MSRPIKFRAWVTEVTGDSFMLHNVTPYYILDEGWTSADKIYGYYDDDGEQRKVKTDTAKFELMQFTGLTDKNGKEIYEGDIVRIESEQTKQGLFHGDAEVVFEDGCYFVKTSRKRWPVSVFKNVEIIGNVHENPELVK